MKKLRLCIRGSVAQRNAHGRCVCDLCCEFERLRKRQYDRSEYKKRWNEKNKEKCLEYSRNWADKNRDKRKKAVTAWRAKNPDKVALMSAKAGAAWSRNNKGERNAITRQRVARKLLRTPSWADALEIRRIYDEAARLTAETGVPHEVDHIYPLQGETVSGLHVADNLQILTRAKNRAKKNNLAGVVCEF